MHGYEARPRAGCGVNALERKPRRPQSLNLLRDPAAFFWMRRPLPVPYYRL